MVKPSIKTLTVKNLINFLIIVGFVALLITGYNFRQLTNKAIENKAMAIAEVVKAGLTSHMKAGVIDKRDYYLNEIKSLYEINRLSIIRTPAVNQQFGAGRMVEKTADKAAEQVFTTKQPLFLLNEFSSKPSVRAIIPYIASSAGNLNCLDCHHVQEGTVLGVVDIELNVTNYRNMSIWVLGGLLFLAIVFLVLIIIHTIRTIQIHIKNPLDVLIDKAKTAYHKHKPINPETFASKEFMHVAEEINQFNSEIIANQDLLEEKNQELLALNDEIETTLRETIFTMGMIEEQRSKETTNHTRRVNLYCNLLASKLGLPDKDIDLITAASPLHDIGKLGIPDSILLKEGQLTEEEHRLMENHSNIGYAMLRHSKRDILQAAAIIAHQHHERWDGTGYPLKLKGEEIHIYGRIVALVDVFDALSSERIYKGAWNLEEIIEYIKVERGKQFDPDLADIFLKNVDEFVSISRQYTPIPA